MHNWRQHILDQLIPDLHRIFLVSDPDNLLVEETLSIELSNRGFEVIEFTDSVEFRYSYEQNYRSRWDRGENVGSVCVLRVTDTDVQALPYDLLRVGKELSFSLGELFPNLSYRIIERLDLNLLDDLYNAQEVTSLNRMGENETIDFVLSYVFKINAHLIQSDHELLTTLLNIHYGKVALPDEIADGLIKSLSRKANFNDWPLNILVKSTNQFYEFLQERWPIYLKEYEGKDDTSTTPLDFTLNYSGPTILPFDHKDVRIYIDNLFAEGCLSPVANHNISIPEASWMACGIVKDSQSNLDVRMRRMYTLVEKTMPGIESRHEDWVKFALTWAELNSLHYSSSTIKHSSYLENLRMKINKIF